VVYPNFNQGVYMAEYLATLLPPAARVGLIGGPEVVDDIELMLGIQHGLKTGGLTLVNDPEDERYKNVSDVAEGGYEKASNLLRDFPELDGLIPYNDETLHGTVRALRDAGRLGEVVIDGEKFDGLLVGSAIGSMIGPEQAATWIPWHERIPYNTLKVGLGETSP
jgi:ABC-type sugar transport system substrate-binding protein